MAKLTNPNKLEQSERFTLFTKGSYIKKLDKISLLESVRRNEKLSRTDLVNDAVAEYIARYEKKNGEIKIK